MHAGSRLLVKLLVATLCLGSLVIGCDSGGKHASSGERHYAAVDPPATHDSQPSSTDGTPARNTGAAPATLTTGVREEPDRPVASRSAASSRTYGSGKPVAEVGAEGVLWVQGVDNWALAVDKRAFDEWVSVCVAKDDAGMLGLMRTGRIFLVPVGTRVKVIDVGFGSVRVRVLEGDAKGMAGWVSYEFVRSR